MKIENDTKVGQLVALLSSLPAENIHMLHTKPSTPKTIIKIVHTFL